MAEIIVHLLPRYLSPKSSNFFDDDIRRATYKTWVLNNNESCSADKMAESGFIYTGSSREPYSTQCFYCKISLVEWEPSDDPRKEHLKHGMNCNFAKMKKSQIDWTRLEWYELKHKYEVKLIREEYENISQTQKKIYAIRCYLN